MTQTKLVIGALVLAMTSTACTSGGGAGGGSGCSGTATKVEQGGFCIDVPKDWEFKGVEVKDEGRLEVTWYPKGGGAFDVRVDPQGEMPADITKTVSVSPGSKVTSGDVAGGKGKWVLSSNPTGGVFSVMVKGPKGVIGCSLSASPDQLAKILALCKTIVPL